MKKRSDFKGIVENCGLFELRSLSMLNKLHRLWRHRAIALLGIILLIVLVGDFCNFFINCKRYSTTSKHAIEQLPPQVIEKEAIVVLTGDRGRIPASLELLRKRGSPMLIISGTGRGATLTELINSQADKARNVQDIWKKITVESNSTSTIENAQETGKILYKQGITRVILITSEYHMLRSLLIFRTLTDGPEYIAYPIASEFTLFFDGSWEELLPALWKTGFEYWKYFLFRNYYLRHLNPA